jgi:autotransporter-associated beta strand protein
MKLSRIPTSGAGHFGIILHFLVLTLLCFEVARLPAAELHWVGGDGAWSVASNWSPAAVPQNGDTLYIDSSSDSTMLNDLNGLVLNKIIFMSDEWDVLTTDYRLTGNPLTLTNTAAYWPQGAIVNDDGGERHVTIQCRLIFPNGGTVRNGSCFDRYRVNPLNYLDLQGMVTIGGGTLQLDCDEGSAVYGVGAGSLTISGEIAGNGTIHAYPQSDSSLHMAGTSGNTFSGELIVDGYSGGSVELEKQAGMVVNDRLTILNGATVRLHGPNQIGNTATVTVSQGSLLDFQNYDQTIGNLVMTNLHADALSSRVDTGYGRLTLNGDLSSWTFNDVVVPTITGTLLLPAGTHVFDIETPANYAGFELPAQVGGAGGFYKIGNAALALRGTNYFSGPVWVTEGIIDVYSTNAFGSTAGGVFLTGGSITLHNLAVAPEPLYSQIPVQVGIGLYGSQVTSVGASVWTGPIVLNTNLALNGGDLTLQGQISGTGGLLFLGGGNYEIGGPDNNTFTGETIVRSPLLRLNKPLGVTTYAGPLTVGQNFNAPAEVRWLQSYVNLSTPLLVNASGLANLNGQNAAFGPVTLYGGTIQTGAGNFFANSSVTAQPSGNTAVISGHLAMSYSPTFFYISNGVAQPALRVDAAVSGVKLYKDGQGVMQLTGANTYTGDTAVEEGTLFADNPAALGYSLAYTYVTNGATLRLGSIDGMAEGLVLNGSGFQGTNGAVDVVGGGRNTGEIILRSPSTIKVEQGAGFAEDNVISGTGPLTKSGPGILYLGGYSGGVGQNFYSGDTIVSGGTLWLSKNQNVRSVPGNLVLGPGSPSVPITAALLHSGVMPAGGTVTINRSSVLDLFGNSQTLSQVNLNDGGSVQTGSGVLSFTAGGQVTVSTQNPSPAGLNQPASMSGKISLPAGDYLTFNVGQYGLFPQSSSPELTVSSAISGSGNIIKSGFGALLLTGTSTFDGTPSVYSGEVDVNAGTLIVGSAGALGGTNGVTYVGGAANLALINGVTIINESLYLNSTATRAVDNRGGVNTWIGPVVLQRDSTIGVAPDWSLTINGVISGTGNLTKLDQGVLSFTGTSNNTFSGDTFVNEGTLTLNKSAYLQSIPANLIIGQTNGSTTAIARLGNIDQIWSNTTVNHGGLLDLNGFDEFTGVLTMNGGGDVQTGTGTIYPFASVIVNPGSFGKASTISGRLGLYPYNIPSTLVPFVINPGSPATNSADCLVTATVVQYTGVGGIQKSGSGVLRLTGTNTYAGSNVVSGGTFWVDGSQPQTPVQMAGSSTLKGAGVIGNISITGAGNTIAPGSFSGTGILTCSNFNTTGAGSADLQIKLNGLNAGTGYDQLNVRGTVNLAGITLKPSLNFASNATNQFIILTNDATDSVTGTFTGLPEAKKLYINRELFQVSYTGGSGNDVVLARLVTPPPPTLTIQRVSSASVRLLWPTNDPPFSLQSATNLATPIWTAVTPLPSLFGTNNVVTNSTVGFTNLAKYYRLISP